MVGMSGVVGLGVVGVVAVEVVSTGVVSGVEVGWAGAAGVGSEAG